MTSKSYEAFYNRIDGHLRKLDAFNIPFSGKAS